MENTDVFLGLHDFLERMRNPSAADFVKAIKSFIVSFSNRAPDPERDSAAVQDFLANMEAAFRAHPLWAGCTEEELESAGEGLEKYVMTKLFSRVFASLPDDAKLDHQLSEKMALVQQFIRPENLDIKPMFQNESSWLLAQKELQKINMYKAPRDKLVCILNCCKVITNLLLNASIASNENPPGADEFLPVLIYVTIKANPPQLHSNLLYIERFRRKSRMVGETAYFFTNILSAESFVSNIDAKALSIDAIEFEKNMESARALLSGLSTDSNDQSNSDVQTTRHFPGVEQSQGKNLPARDKPSEEKPPIGKVSSLSDLENRGAAMLLKEDQGNQVFHDFPYMFADAGDLTISDVENLLNNYKQLVFNYVCLAKGLGICTNPLQSSTSLLQTETTTDSEASGSTEPHDNSEGNMGRKNDSVDSLVLVLQKEESMVSNEQPEDHVAP